MFTSCLTYDDLPSVISVFPLRNALLLPQGLLPLNIFEERYIRMVKDAMESNRFIGVIQPDEMARANGDVEAILKTGCVGRITQFEETDDNRYLITLKGLIRFEITSEINNILPYRQANVNWKPFEDDIVEDCDSLIIDRLYFIPLLKKYMELHQLSCDWDQVEAAPCETLVTTLPMILPFESQDKQMILETKTLDKRYEVLSSLIEISLKSNSENMTIKH